MHLEINFKKSLSLLLDLFLFLNKKEMTLNELLLPSVNWPLFLLTSLIIIFRLYVSSVCSWILNRYYSPTISINEMTKELKTLTDEIKTISQQDQFALYARKERQRNTLVQRLKDEKTNIETKQNVVLTYVRLIFNIGTVLIMIFLTITGRRNQSLPLFNFPFYRFPLILWLMALNTFLTTIDQIYSRYKTNIKSNTD